jgi:hypothetical protein
MIDDKLDVVFMEKYKVLTNEDLVNVSGGFDTWIISSGAKNSYSKVTASNKDFVNTVRGFVYGLFN